jgi:hypothetical protein
MEETTPVPSTGAPSVSYARVVRQDTDTPQQPPDQPPVADTAQGDEEAGGGHEEGDDESFMTVTSKKEKIKNKVDKTK